MVAPGSLAAVHARVMRYGWNSTAYQILNPNIDHWTDAEYDAVVGYVRHGGWWVVAGAPVCALDVLDQVIARFEAAADAVGCRVIYVCAAERLRALLGGRPTHAAATLGAEPVWQPGDWDTCVRGHASIRQQLNRARNKGITVEALRRQDVAQVYSELRQCVEDWLEHRPLPALHFLTEPYTIDGVLTDRRLWVAKRPDGRIVAYLLASPVAARNGYLVEQIARRHEAPNGTTELLIDAALRAMHAWGCVYVTLGLVVLTTYAHESLRQNPPWLRALFGFARLHGRRFYHFDGLEHFRAKLWPDRWEPIYLITNTPQISPAGLYAAAQAFCGDRSPVSVLAGGLWRAIRTEGRWLMRRPPAPERRVGAR